VGIGSVVSFFVSFPCFIIVGSMFEYISWFSSDF
jgi:hypothetical protein